MSFVLHQLLPFFLPLKYCSFAYILDFLPPLKAMAEVKMIRGRTVTELEIDPPQICWPKGLVLGGCRFAPPIAISPTKPF